MNGMKVSQNALNRGQYFLLVGMGKKKDKAEERGRVPPTSFGEATVCYQLTSSPVRILISQ